MLTQITNPSVPSTIPVVASHSAMPETARQQPATIVRLRGFWMVQRNDYRWEEESEDWRSGQPTEQRTSGRGMAGVPQFLQIATGRWVASDHATKFLGREAAEAYAEEYGLDVINEVRVIKRF